MATSAINGARRVDVARLARTVWLASVLAALLFAGVRMLRYTRELSAIRLGAFRAVSPAQSEGPGAMTFSALMGANERRTIDLSGKSALILLYDDKCPACKDNMPRWMDLLVELRQRTPAVPVIAVSLDSLDRQHAYWSGLTHAVQLAQPTDSSVLSRILGTSRLPSTIVVRDGRPVVYHVGAVGDWRRDFLLRTLLD